MRRGKGQVIFRYLPECVIDYSDTGSIAKISSWDATKSEKINNVRISGEILRRIERYYKRNGFPQHPTLNSFVYLEPDSIEANLFPLTFICKECNRAYYFKDISTFNKRFNNRRYQCSCGGALRQLDMVHYCKCGKISGLKVIPCPIHNFEHITLQTYSSSRPSQWRWRCKVCGNVIRDISQWCPECNQRMETAPFRKSQVFYPHSFTLINTSWSDKPEYYDDLVSLKLYLAKYLDIISREDCNTMLSSSVDDSQKEFLEKKRQELVEKGLTEDVINQVIQVFDGSDEINKRRKILSQIDEMMGSDKEEIVPLSSSIEDFEEILSLPGSSSINQVLKIARSRKDPNCSRIIKFPEALSRAGFSDAYVVSDLPLVSAVYGYSRSTPDPGECTIRSFPVDEKYPAKIPVYVNPTETEGIVLTFDRMKILKWLKANDIIPSIPDNMDDTQLKLWFLRNVNLNDIPIYDEIPETSAVTKYVYSLIHTISHVILRNAAGLVGMDKDSLGEILFPSIPAIAIYTNNVHDFQIGGMHTLFETAIIPWLDKAMESVSTCLYDPVCITSDAACHACLYLSEVSCVHFNRDLGRQYLIGRNDGSGKEIGFWENDFVRSF